jgi:hypothetical protein
MYLGVEQDNTEQQWIQRKILWRSAHNQLHGAEIFLRSNSHSAGQEISLLLLIPRADYCAQSDPANGRQFNRTTVISSHLHTLFV